ncbi:MAG: hypothetical protein J6Q65_05365 [Lentisphaeria bacterium]|nr:hypothetical protein [Lentisphaeria bacterium]
MSNNQLPALDRIAALNDLALTRTGENPAWHVYSITDGAPEQTLEIFPDLHLPAVVFCLEKMTFSDHPPIDFRFAVLVCADALSTDENRMRQYRKQVGEIILAQAVMNPVIQLETAEPFTLDPLIRAEISRFSLQGH